MNMYNSNNQNIGTKTITQGGGMQRPDGSNGNLVSMNFNPPQQNPIIQSLAKPSYAASPNFPNGMKAPQVNLKSGQEDTSKIGNFLQYRTGLRNANMAMNYDKMNMNRASQNADRNQRGNQFIKRLALTKSNQDLNRNQNASQFIKRFNLGSQQFDRTFDFNMQKYLHPNATNNTEKYKLDRTKIFTKDPSSLVPHWGDLDDNAQNQVRNSYINTGVIPKINFEKGFMGYGNSATLAGENNSTQTKQQPKKVDTDKEDRFKQYIATKNKEIMNRDEKY